MPYSSHALAWERIIQSEVLTFIPNKLFVLLGNLVVFCQRGYWAFYKNKESFLDMKKLSEKTRYFNLRQALLKKFRQKRKSALIKNRKLYGRSNLTSPSRAIRIFSPKVFDIVSGASRQDLLRFISEIESTLTSGRKVRICFGATDLLHPGGTLYFVATIDILVDKYPNMIESSYPRDDVVEQLFQHIGLLQQFGKSSRKEIIAENVINWHYASGTDATTSVFCSLLVQHQESIGGEIMRSELYDCMSEAVINTRKHAYPKQRDSNMSRWWMFSQVKDGKLTVAICDLGIGIPTSLLEKPELMDYIHQLRYSLKPIKLHGKLIEIALTSNRTSTSLSYRGKGLPQMLDFIRQGSAGGFRVQSGHGIYKYHAEQQLALSETNKYPIKGTLVEWEIPLINGGATHENS
ncbi:hypothetical protein ANRL3_01451 [Anaerolineae bacterium]|nr:hypothetical protein ANRL3_01451 [Anaerolineae bacterium]